MSGVVPKWLEQWLGVESAGSGEGTLWTLRDGWSLAPWITLLTVGACLALVISCYLREAGSASRGFRLALAGIRCLLVGLLFFMLAEFLLSLERTGLPYVVVLVDDSLSMGTEDRYSDEKLRAAIDEQISSAGLGPATRLALAKSVLLGDGARVLRAIDDRYKLKVYFLDDTARLQSGGLDALKSDVRNAKPSGESTRLGQGIRTVLNDLRGTPPTAIVLLSDGITTEGESLADAAGYARRKGVPLFIVGVGSENGVRDLELSDLMVEDTVFVDDIVNFEFKLTATGYAGRKLKVVLHRRGDRTPLASLDVTAGADGKPQRLRLPYRPDKVGEFEYVVEVEHLSDEIQPDNNSQQRLVSVRKEQIRVLLVQSYPNYEFRYLKQMLARDATVALKTVLQEADLDYAETDKTALRVFPERREELLEYDCIIFGDVDPAFLSLTAMQNIAAFVVQKGGGVIFIAGPEFTPVAYRDTPLAPLLPVELGDATTQPDAAALYSSGFQVIPTELGAAMPTMALGDNAEENAAIWRRLPPLYWLFESAELKPAARVLATRSGDDGRSTPVIALQYVGSGKVLFHATDETWRWRFRVGDVFFARYWVQTLRYLSRAKLLGKDRWADLSVDRRQYRRGESAQFRVRFIDERRAPASDDGVTIVIEQQGHQTRRLQLRRTPSGRGVFEGTLAQPPVGKFHAWIATPVLEKGSAGADFEVVAPPGEFERVQMEAAELKRAAETTKGRFYTIANAAGLLSDLPAGHQVPIEALPPIVLWNQWPVLLLFLVLIISEWILRKRKGML
ncbi:MAG TPA: VWA domain-containing protein [Pirellulales bacterium]|jgi:uncharacterized membrane protein|nr:VWA domain-containing protein [Pirellulales bacterium]